MRASSDFRDTMRRGVRAARPTLVLHGRALPSPPSRVGFVVSRAVGGAVVRNRVKRQLRHLVWAQLRQQTALSEQTSVSGGSADSHPTPVAVVVRALPAAAREPDRLAQDVASGWATMMRRIEAGSASASVNPQPVAR